jgi:hypothetical protein
MFLLCSNVKAVSGPGHIQHCVWPVIDPDLGKGL